MVQTFISVFSSAIDSIITWITSIGDSVGFPLWSFLLSMTILGIILSYLVLPAVSGKSGKSDSAKNSKGDNDD